MRLLRFEDRPLSKRMDTSHALVLGQVSFGDSCSLWDWARHRRGACQKGVSQWILDIDEADLASTAREAKSHGMKFVTGLCDLADRMQITAIVNMLRTRWAGLNILVNNAGIVRYGPMHLFAGEECKCTLSINLLASI